MLHSNLHVKLNLKLWLNLGWPGPQPGLRAQPGLRLAGLPGLPGLVRPSVLLYISLMLHSNLHVKLNLKLWLNLGRPGWPGWLRPSSPQALWPPCGEAGGRSRGIWRGRGGVAQRFYHSAGPLDPSFLGSTLLAISHSLLIFVVPYWLQVASCFIFVEPIG